MFLTTRDELGNPNVCFICEAWNPGQYIDTGYLYEPGTSFRLSGKKYICESCLNEAGRMIGLTPNVDLVHLRNEVTILRDAVKTLKGALKSLSDEADSLVLRDVSELSGIVLEAEVVDVQPQVEVAVGSGADSEHPVDGEAGARKKPAARRNARNAKPGSEDPAAE